MPESIVDSEIRRLQGLLNSGATHISSDGESISIDLSAIRTRLAELVALKAGQRHKARRFRTFNMQRSH